MRVAVVCPYSIDVPGGVGAQVLGEVRWLNAQNHEAWLIAPGSLAPDVPHRLVGSALPLPFNGSTARLATRHHQARLAVASIAEADVVHVHEPLTPGIAYAVARRANRLVVTHHASFDPGWLLAKALRFRARGLHPDAVTAVSRAARDTAVKVTGWNPDIVPNAITVPSEPPSVQSAPPRVAFVGRASDPRKGLAAFQRLAELCRAEAEFIAIGPGTHDAAHLRGFGAVTEAKRLALLQTCDVVVAPNTTGESFGLVLAEALAAGCAVIASDLAGFRETLSHARSEGLALLVPVGDAAALGDALRFMLSQGHDRKKAHLVAQQWSWDVVGPRLESVLLASQLR